MQATHWQDRYNTPHWLKHSLLPLLVLAALIFWVPMPKQVPVIVHSVNLTLFTSPPEVMAKPEIESMPQVDPEPPIPVQPATESKPKPPPEKVTEAVTETSSAPPKSSAATPSQETPNDASAPAAKTSTEVIQMLNSRTSLRLTDDFKPGVSRDHFAPSISQHNWRDDIPYLDESVDKPRIHMNFYAMGVAGSIERAFDKITFSKTFTTKYGTKIHCAVVGILAACSWK